MKDNQIDDTLRTIAVRTWDLFKQEPLTYVLASVVVGLLSLLTLGILAGPLTAGFIEMTRRHSRGEPISLQVVFAGMSRVISTVMTFLVVAVGVAVGSMLLLVPGLLVALFSMFAFHRLVYNDDRVGGALVGSFHMVRDNFLVALAVMLAAVALNVLGGSLVFGQLLTGPLSLIALTVAFESLQTASPPKTEVVASANGLPTGSAPVPPDPCTTA